MKWRKLGRVFETSKYAQTPTPLVLEDRVRVYFAERDDKNKSFIRFVDLDIDDPTKLSGEPSGRVLENGPPGAFDSCGQMPSFAEHTDDGVYLYYSGWLSPAGDVPYHNATGLARSTDGGLTFERVCNGPILERAPIEPYLAVTPCLIPEEMHAPRGMYYISGLRWELIGARYEPIYVIKYAQFSDNVGWRRFPSPVIAQAYPHQCFSRPWVWKRALKQWHMWYCHRSAINYRDGANAYRIGYATSPDGWHWTPSNEFRLERCDWDATMQCYPAVFEAKGKIYMLYNGASFGKYGFGLAAEE